MGMKPRPKAAKKSSWEVKYFPLGGEGVGNTIKKTLQELEDAGATIFSAAAVPGAPLIMVIYKMQVRDGK
jgi:hypothetical protein